MPVPFAMLAASAASSAAQDPNKRKKIIAAIVAVFTVVTLLVVAVVGSVTSMMSTTASVGGLFGSSAAEDCRVLPSHSSAGTVTNVGAVDAGSALPDGMSVDAQSALVDAQSRFGVSWTTLAGVMAASCPACARGTRLDSASVAVPAKNGRWRGPMGIRPALWRTFAERAGVPAGDPQDLHDAARVAAFALADFGFDINPGGALTRYRVGPRAAAVPGSSAATVWAPKVLTEAEGYAEQSTDSGGGSEGAFESRRVPVAVLSAVDAQFDRVYSAEPGTAVRAVANGRVLRIRPVSSGQYVLRLRTDAQTVVTYSMVTRPAVKEGEDVSAGKRLGTVLGGGQVSMSVTVNGDPTTFGSWLESSPADQTLGQGSVFVVGDSLTVGMSNTRRDWQTSAFPGLKVSVDAAVSRATARGSYSHRGDTYSHGISVLESSADAQTASTWVVALGSNDLTGSGASSGTYMERINDVMALAQDRSVVWVNVHRSRYHEPRVDPVNAALRQAQSRYASLSVLDWAAAVSGNEDEYLTDGLHLTARGVDRRIELIQRADTSAAGVSSTSLECATSTFGYVLPAGPMAQAAVQWALGRVEAGARYVAGAGRDADPFGMEYDCSSFTYTAYKLAGLNWNMKLSYQQFDYPDFVVEVPSGQEQPGDLIFQDWKRDGLDLPRGYSGRGGIDHVGLVVDPAAQTMVHAANPTSGITVGNYNYTDTRTVAFARVIDPSMANQAGSGAVFLAPVAERVGGVNRYGRNKRSVLQYPVVPRILSEASQYKDVRGFAGNSSNGNQRMKEWLRWNPAIQEGTNRSVAAVMMVREFGFPVSEWACLDRLWWHESGWGSRVREPSRAGGIPQAFPATKMLNTDAGGGADAFDNPVTQIRWGLSYIKNRYSNPCGAWEAWRTNSATGEHGYGWY